MRTFELHGSPVTLLVTISLAGALMLVGMPGCASQEPEGQTQEPTTAEPSTPAPSDTPAEPAPSDGGLATGATHTIAGVLAAPREGDAVVISGTITRDLGDFNFMLGDGPDEVYVDGDDDFGALSVGDALLVTGLVNIEDSPSRVEIDATAVTRR